MQGALRAIVPLSQPFGLPAPPEGAPRAPPHHLPPLLGEVDERSEAGGGLVLFEIALILQPPQSALWAASSPRGGAKIRRSINLQ